MKIQYAYPADYCHVNKLFYVQNFKIKSDLIQKMGENRLVTRFIKQTSCAVLILYKYSTYFD